MEKELLNQMIQDRDRRIASIKRKMEDQFLKMSKFQEELAEIKSKRETSEIDHMDELTMLMEKKDEGERALGRLQNDLKQQQGDSLQLYAEVIKRDAANNIPDRTDSSYVMRMQAQLCKCMHSMGIMENQTELVKSTCDELIKPLKEAVNRTIDEKTNVELQFMNELVMMDNKKREHEEGLKSSLDELRAQIAEIEEKLENHQSDSDSDSEIDEEEEEEKELLKKELKERNEEIAAVQKEIEEQKERIKQLEAAGGNSNDDGGGVSYATATPPEEDSKATPTTNEDVEDGDDYNNNNEGNGQGDEGNEITEDESEESS